MYLIGDIGNTETKICLFDKKNKLTKKIVIKSNLINKKFISKKLLFLKSKRKLIKNTIFSSVVPNIYKIIKSFLTYKIKIKCNELKDFKLNKIINIKVDKNQIGSDRLANAISLSNKINNFIIVDFGTATTFDVIKNNQYLGGLIFPGINLSMETLLKNAELIKTSKISKSNKIVNNHTSASIQSGFYFGYLHAVNGILKQIIKENNFKPKVYITGGLGKIFRDKIIYKPIYMEHLTLEGIKEIGNKHFYE